MNNTLFVIGVVSNPAEYASRIKLYKEFRTRMEETRNVVLITVELAYNNKKFAVTDKNNEHDLQLRTGEEGFLWVKESLINLSRLVESLVVKIFRNGLGVIATGVGWTIVTGWTTDGDFFNRLDQFQENGFHQEAITTWGTIKITTKIIIMNLSLFDMATNLKFEIRNLNSIF